jgi:hypothetical protein
MNVSAKLPRAAALVGFCDSASLIKRHGTFWLLSLQCQDTQHMQRVKVLGVSVQHQLVDTLGVRKPALPLVP